MSNQRECLASRFYESRFQTLGRDGVFPRVRRTRRPHPLVYDNYSNALSVGATVGQRRGGTVVH